MREDCSARIIPTASSPHDWTDEVCVEILEGVRSAASRVAPVFVAEWVVPGPDTSHFAKLVDEYGELSDRAGLELAGHHTVAGQP